MKRLNTLIVDDEPLARDGLRLLLESFPEILIVGEADNGVEAVNRIRAHKPDLVFLDVQMPDLDGFGVIEQLVADELPQIIFVTAFDQYALAAFEVNASDYLLKPVNEDKLRRAVRTVLEQLELREQQLRVREMESLLQDYALLDELRRGKLEGQAQQFVQRFPIRDGERIKMLALAEILFFEANGDYVNVHHREKVYMVGGPLTRLEARLPETIFRRIHRSTIINIHKIESVQPLINGEYTLYIKDSSIKLKSSRRYRQVILNCLKKV